MTFSSIRHGGSTYHGILVEKREKYFIFAFRNEGRNYIWECHYDYWDLIE